MQLFAMKIAHGSSSCAPQRGQNPKNPLNLAKSEISYTIYTKMEVTSWKLQFMICPILWNEVQLPNIKILLKRKMILSNFWTDFPFFSGKHVSPRLQKQHICFAARLGFIAFQGRQSQTNTFSSQSCTFSFLELLFLELLRRAFWNMILQHQHLSEVRLHFKLLHLRKMLKRHDLATKMRWATVQEKWKWTVTKKPALIQELKSESEIQGELLRLQKIESYQREDRNLIWNICSKVN